MSTEQKKLKCGLVMPISAIGDYSENHWDEVRRILQEALDETIFVVELVSDSNEVGIIQKRIVQNLYDNDIVICDVSGKNPNVMFELGIRLAFDKPAIIIKDDKTNYSFDTAPIEHLEYPSDLHYHPIQEFKLKLRAKVIATFDASKKPEYTTFLKNFGQFVVAKLDEKKVGKEDYLIAAVSELRQEMHLLSKAVRPRDDLSMALPEWLHRSARTHFLSEKEFIHEKLSAPTFKHKLSELKDPNSEAFHSLLEEYLLKHTSPNIAVKSRNSSAVHERFLAAINEIA